MRHALLALLYNTGARIQEALDLCPQAVRLESPAPVRLVGKGRKERLCPIWPETAELLAALYDANHGLRTKRSLSIATGGRWALRVFAFSCDGMSRPPQNSQKPANAWRRIKKSCLPFTTSQLNIGRIYELPTPSNLPLLPSDYELTEPRGPVHESPH